MNKVKRQICGSVRSCVPFQGERIFCLIQSSSRVLLVAILFAFGGTSVQADQGIRFQLEGQATELLPVGYTTREILGLKRNGSMLEVDPDAVQNPSLVPRFNPYSQSEMRGELLREFGKQFEVSGTGTFIIAHPKGRRGLWVSRFEELYRSMTQFFRTRGFAMNRPQFPLVGVVFYSKSQYRQYINKYLNSRIANSVGLYSPRTNRIYLYDATDGEGTKSRRWEDNLATIMHEVAHQTAFNTGIHVRYGESPVWTVEGLGCMFEAKGIYDAAHHRSRQDRINYGRLEDFRNLLQKTRSLDSFLMTMIARDDVFKRETDRAYAAAWALTFYLSETQPRDYARYLKTVAEFGPMDRYPANDRVKDFLRIFGVKPKMLTSRLSRFVDEI